ncbi:hypothetical protein [Rhodoferax sp.]|uniref:hypothetical protein n=1 Tax=Rhodoferax sp. TaxID=50421 RepID=UPI00276304B1|nr:hypothetical protein [Rhodoferax sp.]
MSLLDCRAAPFSIPEQPRFEHQWVVAPQGSGKTQLLQSQIAKDLERVARGEASIIVIDSQGRNAGKEKKKDRTLIQNLTELKIFAEGEALEDKLIVLQPDTEHPLALNLFDMGQHNPDLSPRERQILHMSSLKLVSFCLSGTTGQQEDMIDYLVQLAMAVPDATIDTVRRMLTPKGIEEFRPYFDQVDEVVRDYFLHVFNTQSQNVTKEAVMRRVMGMLKNPTFRKMYQNRRNKFSMLREIDAGKVIVINTDMELLGREACELFGRFFISLLVQATQQRTNSKPVYCYIDECQDYIAADENIASLLDKARKQKVGFILAHQRLSNITSPNVLDALSNVAVKFAGGNITDAPTLSRYMRAPPEFISNQPRLSFAAFVRGHTPQAIQVSVPYGVMEEMPRMTEAEQSDLQRSMRERYAVSSSDPSPAKPTEPPDGGPQWDDVV